MSDTLESLLAILGAAPALPGARFQRVVQRLAVADARRHVDEARVLRQL